jgi:hypothetical protein
VRVDLREDAAALFGHSSEHPVHVGYEQQGGGEEGQSEEDKHNAKRCRPSTSPIWLDFEKLFKTVNGKKVKYEAKCLHCFKQYSAFSSGGTGHLTRHRDRCPRRREKTRMSQSQIFLILMVVCVTGSVVLWLHVMNWFDCLLG